MRAPHYIWLFLILILSIPHYFVISNHIILLISKKNQNKFFSIERNFKLTSDLKQNTPRNYPEPRPVTRGIGFHFPDPQGMTNCHSLDSPNPRGMKIAGKLASLSTTGVTLKLSGRTPNRPTNMQCTCMVIKPSHGPSRNQL